MFRELVVNQIALLLNRIRRYKVIENILNVSQGYVSKGKKRFIEQGIQGLRLGYKGAKTKLTKEEKEETIKWLLCQEYWDLSELKIYLIEE